MKGYGVWSSSLDSGQFYMHIPASISLDELDDVKETVAIAFKVMGRVATRNALAEVETEFEN
jgi:hypothetical protein